MPPITAVTSWTLFLVPVVGVGMSVLILREPVTPPEQFIGGDATVVAALAIVARSGRQKQNDVTPPSAQ